jgi:hypothetical protein
MSANVVRAAKGAAAAPPPSRDSGCGCGFPSPVPYGDRGRAFLPAHAPFGGVKRQDEPPLGGRINRASPAKLRLWFEGSMRRSPQITSFVRRRQSPGRRDSVSWWTSSSAPARKGLGRRFCNGRCVARTRDLLLVRSRERRSVTTCAAWLRGKAVSRSLSDHP